jgi:hypothetical protein
MLLIIDLFPGGGVLKRFTAYVAFSSSGLIFGIVLAVESRHDLATVAVGRVAR